MHAICMHKAVHMPGKSFTFVVNKESMYKKKYTAQDMRGMIRKDDKIKLFEQY